MGPEVVVNIVQNALYVMILVAAPVLAVLSGLTCVLLLVGTTSMIAHPGRRPGGAPGSP